MYSLLQFSEPLVALVVVFVVFAFLFFSSVSNKQMDKQLRRRISQPKGYNGRLLQDIQKLTELAVSELRYNKNNNCFYNKSSSHNLRP